MKTKLDGEKVLAKMTKKKCHYCGKPLYISSFDENQHWCSNANCPKGIPFGLDKQTTR